MLEITNCDITGTGHIIIDEAIKADVVNRMKLMEISLAVSIPTREQTREGRNATKLIVTQMMKSTQPIPR
ncbi:MAG: hypothetical protein U1G05_18925 [Kiritimatiellia bacterium]